MRADIPDSQAITGDIRFWRYLTDIGIFEVKIGASEAQIFL
jgi:hypothetical protein